LLIPSRQAVGQHRQIGDHAQDPREDAGQHRPVLVQVALPALLPDTYRHTRELLGCFPGHFDRGALSPTALEFVTPILIRRSGANDQAALERLAAVDSRTLPAGSFLLAEVEGELVAAAPIDVDAEALGDPFRPTADIRELLGQQADQVRRQRDALAPRGGAGRPALPDTA
jgi:hypothetical protein